MKENSLRNFLNPEVLKSNLIMASIYITAFELLKDSIIGHPKTLFSDGFNSRGLILSNAYKTKVLSLNRSPLYASLEWFKGMEAISQDDIELFDHLKNFRNKLSHEMAEMVFEGINQEEYSKLFIDLIGLFEKIDKWWINNFELAIDPDINWEGADLDSAQSSTVMMLRVMLDMVSSNEEDSWEYYNSLFKEENR